MDGPLHNIRNFDNSIIQHIPNSFSYEKSGTLDTKQKLYNFNHSNVSFFYLLTLLYMIDSRLLAEWIWIKYIYILSEIVSDNLAFTT